MIQLLVSLALAASAAPAEVKAGKGPVQLTLRLLNDKVSEGQYPWYKLELKNVGTKPIQVRDEAFLVDAGKIISNSWDRRDIYIDLRTEDGKQVPIDSPALDIDPADIEYCRSGFKKVVKGWVDAGMSDEEVKEQVRLTKCHWLFPKPRPKFLVLKPGEALVPPAHYFSRRPRSSEAPSDYSEFYGFLLKPGRYKVRAVYDWTFLNSPKLQKLEKQKRDEWLKFQTPFVSLEVLP